MCGGDFLEDFKINVKIILSGLWTSLVFCFAYADILAHMRSDIIEGILVGELAGIQLTSEALMGSAVLMLIPILMVVLSLALPAKVNRWTNVALGGIYAAINLMTMIMTGGAWIYYYIFAVVEVVISILIVWYAWKWQ